MELGITNGVEIGAVLNKCLEMVVEDNSLNNKETLITLLRTFKKEI